MLDRLDVVNFKAFADARIPLGGGHAALRLELGGQEHGPAGSRAAPSIPGGRAA